MRFVTTRNYYKNLPQCMFGYISSPNKYSQRHIIIIILFFKKTNASSNSFHIRKLDENFRIRSIKWNRKIARLRLFPPVHICGSLHPSAPTIMSFELTDWPCLFRPFYRTMLWPSAAIQLLSLIWLTASESLHCLCKMVNATFGMRT